MADAAKTEPQQVMVLMTEGELRRIIGEALRAELANRPAEDRLLTSQEVGELVGVNPKTVQKWADRDGLPAVRIGRQCRFRREAVTAWLEERAVKPGGHVTKHVSRLQKLR